MKVKTVVIFALCVVLFATSAYAGVFGKIGDWLKGEVLAVVLTALLAVVAGATTVVFSRIVTTLKEAGEFLSILGAAIEDKKITEEEISSILKEGKDVLNPWKKTPEKYQVSNG